MAKNERRKAGRIIQHRKKNHAGRKPPIAYNYGEHPYRTEEIVELQHALGIANDWDVILVGDGSQGNETKMCGWGVILFDKMNSSQKTFYGAASSGGCLASEITPYLQSLIWFDRFRGRKRKKLRSINIHIATDSEIIAKQGQELSRFLADPRRLQSTRPLWQILQQIEQTGYKITWHWIRRGTLEANRTANRIAQAARWQMERAQTGF